MGWLDFLFESVFSSFSTPCVEAVQQHTSQSQLPDLLTAVQMSTLPYDDLMKPIWTIDFIKTNEIRAQCLRKE